MARRRELLEQMRNAMETHDDRSVSDHLEAISKLDRMRQSGGEERRSPRWLTNLEETHEENGTTMTSVDV